MRGYDEWKTREPDRGWINGETEPMEDEEEPMMNKIERYSQWCEIDRLEGVDVKNGELLFVRFPNGHAQGVTAVVKVRNTSVSEQGGQYTMRESIAYAEAEYHGVKILVPLVGLEARRA
jgi:hypothetical protein